MPMFGVGAATMNRRGLTGTPRPRRENAAPPRTRTRFDHGNCRVRGDQGVAVDLVDDDMPRLKLLREFVNLAEHEPQIATAHLGRVTLGLMPVPDGCRQLLKLDLPVLVELPPDTATAPLEDVEQHHQRPHVRVQLTEMLPDKLGSHEHRRDVQREHRHLIPDRCLPVPRVSQHLTRRALHGGGEPGLDADVPGPVVGVNV